MRRKRGDCLPIVRCGRCCSRERGERPSRPQRAGVSPGRQKRDARSPKNGASAMNRVDQICRYDFILGELFAAAVIRLCEETKTDRSDVDLVAAAGQTIWHDPEPVIVQADVDWIDHPIETRSTLAIGQSAVIAERTG